MRVGWAVVLMMMLAGSALAQEPPVIYPPPQDPVWIPPGQGGQPPPPAPYTPYAPPPADTPEPETRKQWYGWQLLLADAASFALAGAGEGGATVGSLAFFFVNGPLVHGLHGRGERAVLTVAGRVGIPLIIVLGILMTWDGWGYDDEDTNDGNDELGSAIVVGGVIGFVAFYAWDVATASETIVVQPRAPAWQVGGTITPDGASVGVMGRF